MSLFLAVVSSTGLLAGLIHLVILLIVIAIVYFICQWVLAQLGAPPMILKLIMILCALIALYFVIVFLLNMTP